MESIVLRPTALPHTHISSRPSSSTTRRSPLVVQASATRSRRAPQLQRQVADLLDSLEKDGQLATYELNLTRPTSTSSTATSTSSFSSETDTSTSSSSTSSGSSLDSGNSNVATSSFDEYEETMTSTRRNRTWKQQSMYAPNTTAPESATWSPASHNTREFTGGAPAIKQTASIQVCQGKACRRQDSERLFSQLQDAARQHNISVTGCKCLKQCKRGPTMRVEAADDSRAVTYTNVNGSREVMQVLQAALHEF